jgi:hypothetical protein
MSTIRLVAVCLIVGFAAVAIAQPAGSAAPPEPAGSGAPPAVSPQRAACVDAMNADPTFARSIIDVARKREDVGVRMLCEGHETLSVHKAAEEHVQKNQRHVLWAYAAMWIIAAGFLLYLWRRQLALKTEIARLRRDLDAASK